MAVVMSIKTGRAGAGLSGVFVPDWDDRRDWAHRVGSVAASEVLRGSSETDLEVVIANAPAVPRKGDTQGLWRARSRGGVNPLLLAVAYPAAGATRVCLLGLAEDDAPVLNVELRVAEQLISDALGMTSPSRLHNEVRRRLATLSSGVASALRNEGLLASHVLQKQVQEPGWTDLCGRSQPLLALRGEPLLAGLGYTVEAVPEGTVVREATGGQRRAAVVLLAEGESFDNPLGRFLNANAVSHGLRIARRESVPWVIVLGGSVLRLYPAGADVGVGRKGQTQTYVELDLALISPAESGYLALLFAPEAVTEGGVLRRLLADSARYATGLSERLRERIYTSVVPGLALAVAAKRKVTDKPLEEQQAALAEAYHQTMIILFRLLFVAYAEDRGLLPFETSERYRRNALKTLAEDLLDEQEYDRNSTTYWDDLTQVWKVIDTGDLGSWGIPAYNGGLFTQDETKNPSGAETYDLALTNDVVCPALAGLLIDRTRDGQRGPVDFRSLSVREFGTIYEGLLESSLDTADADLILDENLTYVPATRDVEASVRRGEVYFHDRSGSRKASGSYFTKPFAVTHLLDSALEPAIDAHLTRVQSLLDAGATKSAAEALFDFRVADLAMGSGHFLVAAVDRMEVRFSAFRDAHPMPEVDAELSDLRRVAAEQLRVEPVESGIDDGALLRRQIARRCVYGTDLNEIAVELARLAVWIHTFVPGLPLSFLNHNLVTGDSLTGVGSLPEILDALADAEIRELKRADFAQTTNVEDALRDVLSRAEERLASLGALTDASVGDVALAGQLHAQLQADLAPLAALCHLITAERTTRHLGNISVTEAAYDKHGKMRQARRSLPHPDRILLAASPGLFTATTAQDIEAAILAHPQLERARQLAESVNALHYPVAFPEVFQRDRPGFDCLLGNPPWEKMKVEEHAWWALRFPGLRSMTQAEKNQTLARLQAERPDLVDEYAADAQRVKNVANILAAGPYPGLRQATDTDLFAAFAWRFWHELRDGGYTGVVLPRTALAGAGTEDWRKRILESGQFADVTLLTNTGRWAFDMEPRYTIGLVTLRKGNGGGNLRIRGPYPSFADYSAGMLQATDLSSIPPATVLGWSASASLPSVPSRDLPVFSALRLHPRLDDLVGNWQFQPIRELHTTDNKSFYDFNLTSPQATHTLPVLTGGTFNLWEPDFGAPYAHADPHVVVPFLQNRRMKSARRRNTAFVGIAAENLDDPLSLPLHRPRVAFRNVARATDSRTLICALVPPEVVLVELAPYLLRQHGTARDEAYLLGILSSIPLDWYTRRFVEQHMTSEHLNGVPVPRVHPDTGRLLDRTGTPMGVDVDHRPLASRLVEISGRLAAKDDRYADWAAEVGVPVGSVTPSERDRLITEVDALAALLFGLNLPQVDALFASFHRGWNYTARLNAVREHFARWTSHLQGVTA